MKKFTYSGILSLTALALFAGFIPQYGSAQITLNSSDLPALAHDYVQATDTTPTVTQGGSGASQTWNLTGIKSTKIDTIFCVSPSATPYASQFPASNLAGHEQSKSGLVYLYLSTSVSSFGLIGEEGMSNGTLYKLSDNPGEKLLALTATYKTNWSSTYRQVAIEPYTATGYDSLKQIIKYIDNDTVDAWGNVTTPAGGPYNSLRIKKISSPIYDSLLVRTTAGVWIPVSTTIGGTKSESFVWWANGKGINIAEVDLDSLGGSIVNGASYLSATIAGVNEVSNNGLTRIYPDPSSYVLNIVLSSAGENGYVKIMDMTGKQIETLSLHNGMSQLKTSGYANGIYIYTITDMDGNMLDKGKFSVSH